MVEKKNKWEEFKGLIKNPPPERLANIEYKSSFYLIVAYLFASVMFIFKTDYWFVIPIFILSGFIAYAQGMAAYNKYKTIKFFLPKQTLEDLQNDISLTRKRSKIINHIFGDYAGWIIAFISTGISIMVINPNLTRWKLMLFYPIVIITCYVTIYFFILYWIANFKYHKELDSIQMKGGGLVNGKSKKS